MKEDTVRGFDLVPLLLVVGVGACAGSAAQESAELAAVADRWEQAFNAGDLDALVALYAEGARLLPPNAGPIQGRSAVRASFSEMIATGIKGELQTVEAVVAGDIGYRVGTYSLRGPGGAAFDRGKYVETWRRIDGAWQIENDIWNSDLPAPFSRTTLIITHEVDDVARWRAAWQGAGSRHALFAQHGAPTVRTFRSPTNARLTGLLVDVADMDAFQAFLNSPAAASAKAEDGVRDATVRVLEVME
jgi:uncharacterized protein (TIGR02246 family)